MFLQLGRVSQPVAAVAALCAAVSLMKICSCATDASDEALDKKRLAEFYSKLIHLFAAARPNKKPPQQAHAAYFGRIWPLSGPTACDRE